MIVDCYTHIWDSPRQLGRLADRAQRRPLSTLTDERESVLAGAPQHRVAADQVDATIVLGFRSVYLGAEISNDDVAAYVRTRPDQLIGFAGIDPSELTQATEELARASSELGMKGVAVSPAAQNLHPSSSESEAIYEQAVSLQMPVMFHPGIQLAAESALEFAQPVLLDEVARNHPKLKMLIAHLGYPWVRETLVLLAKHDNVFADISWLLHQPFEAYQALLAAHQYGVMDKCLFGSGFPYSSPSQSIEGLYSINQVCTGTNLPKIPRDALKGIVEREALDLLGISLPDRVAPRVEPLSDDQALS